MVELHATVSRDSREVVDVSKEMLETRDSNSVSESLLMLDVVRASVSLGRVLYLEYGRVVSVLSRYNQIVMKRNIMFGIRHT